MKRSISYQKKLYLSIIAAVLIIALMSLNAPYTEEYDDPQRTEYLLLDSFQNDVSKQQIVKDWLELRKQMHSKLSKLGRILFMQEALPVIAEHKKKFQILVWKYGPTIEARHLKAFSDKRNDPFFNCPVKNCDITYNSSSISTAEIVIFHLHRMTGVADLPKGPRDPYQIWAFLTDESPKHTFLHPKVKLSDFDGFFNWSMTYRMDSDIPVPYGRTVIENGQKPKELILKKRRDVLIAILGSNCGGANHRWKYVKELQKHIQVDIYGGCGPLKCPGHFRMDCPNIDRYLFYLSFENSNCNDYLTEKLWWNAYYKNSIPIVMGAQSQNYKTLLPPNSYINIDEFASPAVLAQYIEHLNKTDQFKEYYNWKSNFRVVNEHGYFKTQSFHYCRVCQALNYNDRSRKVYSNLTDFWSYQKNCYPAWDE